jgi:hypothetical protein
MKSNTAERRFSLVTVFVSAQEVRRAPGCSRSLAYEHLRRAAGRGRPGRPGSRPSTLHLRQAQPTNRGSEELERCHGRQGLMCEVGMS